MVVKGTPVAKGRPRTDSRSGNIYTDKETEQAEDDVKLDQIYITERPDDRPAGIMRNPE